MSISNSFNGLFPISSRILAPHCCKKSLALSTISSHTSFSATMLRSKNTTTKIVPQIDFHDDICDDSINSACALLLLARPHTSSKS